MTGKLRISIALMVVAVFLSGVSSTDAARRKRGKQVPGLEKLTPQKLKNQRQSIQGQKRSLELKKIAAKRTANKVVDEIENLDARLGQTQDRLRTLDLELARLKTHTTFLVRERDQKVVEFKEKREKFKKRLVGFYKAGNASTVGILLEAKDYSDLRARGKYVRAIVNYDKAMLDRVKSLYEEIQDKISEVDEQMAKTRQVEQEVNRRQGELKNEQAAKQKVLRRLYMDIEAYERAIDDLEAISNAIAAEISSRASVLSRGLTRDGFMWPVVCRITSEFGYRVHPIFRRAKMHTGIDLGCPHGSPIRAASSGRVYWAAGKRGYGNTVILVHAGGISTLYAHMSRIAVGANQLVKRGQVIGYVGSTGFSTGPHLHYEVHRNGKVINPRSYMR